jgi:UrcA family protein
MFAKSPLAILSALAVLGCAAQAQAAPVSVASDDPSVLSVTVSVADLNLGARAGAKTALQRIHAAAKTVCGEEPDIGAIERMALYGACIRTSTDRAVASLDSPIATAMNGGRPDTAMMVANGR